MRVLWVFAGLLLSGVASAAGNVWLVQVDIDKVSESNLKQTEASTNEPTPVTRNFGYKFYLYQDGAGIVSLLPTAGVFYDKRSGKDTECAETQITDGMKLYLELNYREFYKGCHLRTLINSSIPYDNDRLDFPNVGAVPQLKAATGSIAKAGQVSLTVALSAAHPVNPFRHIYHPDHGTGREIGRTLSFSSLAPVEGKDNTYSATVAETVSGLQRVAIKSSGKATFVRIHENVVLGLNAP